MTAGSILEGAFGLIRKHPLAVAAWGLIYLAVAAGTSLMMRPMLGQAPDPQAMAAQMAEMFNRLMLLQFAFMILFVAMWTAAQRAILHPSESAFAFIRFGMDEIRMFVLMIILFVIFYAGFLIAAIGVALIAGAAYMAAGGGAAVAVGAVATLIVLGAVIWLEVRLSLAFPLTLLRREIVLGESWRLTRGRFWTLFGAYLVIFVLILAVSLAATFASTGSYILDIVQNFRNPEEMQRVVQAQMARQFSQIDAMTVLGWLLNAAAGALTIALGGGAAASAARELVGPTESVADTFA